MRVKKVVLDYSGFKDDELNTMAGKVLDCLQDHPTFVEPPVAMDVIAEQTEDFRAKWQVASRGGSLLEIAEKNDAKDLLADSFRQLAFYVNQIAKGRRSLLLSSGLQLEADPKPSLVPDVITGVGLEDGRQKNQMNVLMNSQKAAMIYAYEIADEIGEDGEPLWKYQFQTSDSRQNVFAPTVPDRTYYLRVRGINKKGIGDWSAIASLKAR